MVDLTTMLEKIADAAEKNAKVNPEDYIGSDGLLRCGKCGGKKQTKPGIPGWTRIVFCDCDCVRAEKEAAQVKERHERFREELLEKCFTDPAMREWTFAADNGNNPKLMEISRKFVEDFEIFRKDGRGLLLFGTTGVGKSWAAGCIANALIEKEIACKFLDFSQIANILSERGTDRMDYIQTLARYPLLILDDLNAERDTSYMDEVVFSVIDARAKAKTPLIVTTNLTRQDFAAPKNTAKGRVISRLFDLCIPYEVTGADQRKEGLRRDMDYYKGLLGI